MCECVCGTENGAVADAEGHTQPFGFVVYHTTEGFSTLGTALLSNALSMLADERRMVQLTVETILPIVSNPVDYLLSILVAR